MVAGYAGGAEASRSISTVCTPCKLSSGTRTPVMMHVTGDWNQKPRVAAVDENVLTNAGIGICWATAPADNAARTPRTAKERMVFLGNGEGEKRGKRGVPV